ncbi:MAG: hypothetical protein ACR2QH_17655 [Geminicoccaceae bacterium]
MTAKADATHRAQKQGFWAAARDYPLLVAISALLLFAAALVGSRFLGTAERVNTIVDVVRLDLDQDANDPNSLIRTAPLSIDAEREAVLSEELIGDALKKMPRDPASATSDGRDLEISALTKAILKTLEIKAGVEIDKVEMSLSPDTVEPAVGVADVVNAIAESYIDLRNRERKQQKEEALSWADKKLAYWQGAIDILKASHHASSDGSAQTGIAITDSTRLLGFFMDANRSAQADMLSKIENTVSTVSDQPSEISLYDLEHDYTTLQQDLKKLERVLLRVNYVSDDDAAKPSNLKDAEENLALFKKDLEGLISSGVLDQPAAKIVLPAKTPPWGSLLQWNILVPLAGALSIMIALALAFVTSRWRGSGTQRAAGEPGVLSDPYWPMTPLQRREELATQSNRMR